ncbi:MAG: alpha,alpha-trehalose-phosphate synthase (UDP-forming) [Gammaproteobacteria bacterium]|nr:MAG: alpha,alpha-trehalose-phosphate synthase (UDP-forming) [Gammaproteobacteria bacterium]
MTGRLIAVSNRVAIPRGGQAAGGLAVGVLAALQEHGGIWFGWDGKTTDSEPHDARLQTAGNVTYATINLNATEFDAYYNGFSNETLWPLFHFLLGFFRYNRHNFEAYLRVNALFARKLVPLLEPDDILWIHDYHLIPLAAELRRAGVTQPIGFFLHVPFPSFDVLRALPVHEHLLRCLCSYDVVGFHTQRDLRAFQECIAQPQIGGHILTDGRIRAGERTLRADVFPIGIDVDTCARLGIENADKKPVQRLRQSLLGRRMIMGVDRLDYSKGLPERFRAYERLLEHYPGNRGDVVLLQIAPPTRTGVRTYAEIREELERIAGHINGRFAEIDWVPVRYLNRGFDRGMLMALYREARVGLVTPVRDGMNLVAKEYVAAQDPDDPGVLVLSTLAGAAFELEQAVLINPYDTDGVAEGIQTALEMSLVERRERHAAMLEVLRRNDIEAWRTRFVGALEDMRERSGPCST